MKREAQFKLPEKLDDKRTPVRECLNFEKRDDANAKRHVVAEKILGSKDRFSTEFRQLLTLMIFYL